MAQSSSGSSGSQTTPWAGGPSEGLVVNLIGDLLGPGISEHVGVMAGDLGIMASLGTGKEFAIIFGDSFRGARFGEGEWMSPVGVVAEFDTDGRIIIKRALNNDEVVQQLLDYEHNARGLTLLPSDVINIDGTLYMQGMWNEGVGNVLYTQIWRSPDQGVNWENVDITPNDYMGGMGNLITWDLSPDGYVYMMSSQFKRSHDVYLTRFRPEDIGTREAWEHYSLDRNGTGTWGTAYTPVLSQSVRAGEMSLRHIEGHWVLSMFNAETMAIEVRISREIARDWNEITPANVVVAGSHGWGGAQDENNFTQLYGGYIAPGSTLGNMDLVVSQWNTSNNSRYMSTQFNVQGLDKFFGITPEDAMRSRSLTETPQAPAVGNQDVIKVEVTQVDEQVAEQLAPEEMMESLTEITVIPLDDADPVFLEAADGPGRFAG
nr:DUF4185 domain-containing protein [Corynebacterium comes]